MLHRILFITTRIGLVLALLLGGAELCAQDRDTTDSRDLWVASMLERICLDLSLTNDVENFELGSPSERRVFKPHLATNFRFYFRYRFLTLSTQWSPHFLPGNGDDLIKGSTDALRLRVAVMLPRWNVELLYNRARGHYLENTGDFIPWQPGEPYLLFPHLNLTSIRVRSMYIADPRFSFRSIVDQSDRQLRSAGSFTPAITLRYYVTDDRSYDPGSQRSENYEVSLGPGYFHTFVLKKDFFFAVGGMASLGYLNTDMTTRQMSSDLEEQLDDLIFRGEALTGLWYNGERFYTGIFYTPSAAILRKHRSAVINPGMQSVYRVFVGVRFLPPGFLKRTTERISEIVPLL